MYVLKKLTKNPEHTRVLIVETVREDAKVKEKIVSNIGVARNPPQLANFLKVAHASLEYEIENKYKCELLFKYGDNLDELEKIHPKILEFRTKSFKEIKRLVRQAKLRYSRALNICNNLFIPWRL